MAVADIYAIDLRADGKFNDYLQKIGIVLETAQLAEVIPRGKKVTVIKANYCPPGYTRHIRPVYLRGIVEKIKEMEGFPAVADTSRFFPKGKVIGDSWLAAADAMGYTEASLGCDRFIANGYEGDDGEFISTGGAELGGVEVARAFREAECLVVVTHVTAHPMAGMAGAIVNTAVECLNNSGKARIFEGMRPEWEGAKCNSCGACAGCCQWGALKLDGKKLFYDPTLCAGCGLCLAACPAKALYLTPQKVSLFQKRVAEAPGALLKTLKKKAIFVNLLLDVVPQTYRHPWCDLPFVPDLGVLVSRDPVAIDSLTCDMVAWAKGIPGSAAERAGVMEKGTDKFAGITGIDPRVVLEEAEKMGLGTRDYEVLTLRG